ncbi:MAG: AAA family ATPase [Acidimicrobiales bacterium]
MADKSPNLIQRAAARLRDSGRPSVVELAAKLIGHSGEPASATEPAPVSPESADAAPPRARSRQITIDHDRLARMGFVIPSDERSRTVEEFRIIKHQIVRQALHAEPSDEPCKRLVMVTSARPAEGKTFVSINLALSIASEQEMKVLLVDCDTHRQTAAETLGIKGEKGLMDLLSDRSIDMSDVLLRTDIPGLTVLPAGTGGPHVPELLSSRRMAELLREMGNRYSDRFIIFDTSPCLSSSDASTMAALMGQIVFVVGANRTQQHEVESALGLISDCPDINLVLNGTEAPSAGEFGSYSYY